LCACASLFVWGGYSFPKYCDLNLDVCDVFPFGDGLREEDKSPTIGENLGALTIEAFGLPTIILAFVLGAYFSGRFLYRLLNSN
jgi:hypothetical protein